MKSPRLKKKDSASMLTKPVLTPRSALSSSSKASKPAPVSFNIGRMIRYDTQKKRSTSSVSKILAKPSEYSSPSGIQEFIYIHTVEKTHYHSAVIIQRTWKRYKALKRLFRFLKFAHNIVYNENRFVFYTWLIRLTPPANVAKRIYANVTQYLVDRSFTMNDNLRIATFDEFMKTNCIIVRKDIDYSKIIRFIKILNIPTMRKILSLWSEYAVDQVTVKRCQMKGNLLWKNRDKFGGEFITFHFWRNYTSFKKNNKFNIPLEAHMYIPEWAFYRSAQETKFRMQKAADQKRKIHLLTDAFYALRENSLYESKLEIKYHNCVKIFMRSTMQKAVRAFINNVICIKFNNGILKRLIRAWYHAIDKEIIKKNSIGAFKRRIELKIMSKIFIEWQKYSKQEMARYLKLIIDARNNELMCIRVIYALQNDKIHFLKAESFARWKYIIKMKKRANRFSYWVFNYAQQREFKKFVLDVFKENAGRPMKSKDIWPFKFETNKMYLNRNKKIGKNSKTAHFWRQIQKLIAKNEPIPFAYPSCTVSSSIYALKNVENYPLYGDWDAKATSDQVRSLFYRIILLLTHSSQIRNQIQPLPDKEQALADFREKNNLFSFSTFCELRDLLESEESDRRLKRVYRYQRDYDQLMSLEAHDAAQVFHTSWPVNFSLNDEPKTIFSIDSPMKSSEQLKVSKNYQDDNLNENLNENHPFLQPIEQIKSQIIANNRKYLRKPEDVFTNNQKVLPTIITSQIPGHRRASNKHEKILTGYENHVPIVLNPDITDMLLGEGEFKIQELRYLQDSAHKELLKRQRTEDIKVINDSRKARSRQFTINPKDISKILVDNQQPPTLLKPKNLTSFPKLVELPKIESVPSTNNLAIEKGIMLSTVSSSFLDDKSHFLNPQKRRIEIIMRKYLEFLNFLIFGSKSAFERVDFEMLHMRLIKIMSRLSEQAKKAKQKKKPKSKKKRNLKSPNSKSKPIITTQPQQLHPQSQSHLAQSNINIRIDSQDSNKSQLQLQQQQQQIELKESRPSTPLKKKIIKSKPKSQLVSKSKPKFESEAIKINEESTESDSKLIPKNVSLKKASSNTISPHSKASSKSPKGKKGKNKSPSPSSANLKIEQQNIEPVDPHYFTFAKPTAREDWTIDFFGKVATNDTSNLSPFEHFIGSKILYQHVKAFLFIEGNSDEVSDHFKREIEWVPDYSEQTRLILANYENKNKKEEEEKDEEETKIEQQRQQRRVVFQTVARLKSRAQRKTTLLPGTKLPEEEEELKKKEKEEEIKKANEIEKNKSEVGKTVSISPTPKLNTEIPLIQRKFTFATDIIGAIISLSLFFSPYLLIFYEQPEQVEAFTGIEELRSLIRQRLDTKESDLIVVPEEIVTPPKTETNKDDYFSFYTIKTAATTEDLTPVLKKRRVSTVGINKRHRKTINLAPGDLKFDKDLDSNANEFQAPSLSPASTQPLQIARQRGGGVKGRRKSIRIFTPPKIITEKDIDLFLCLSPYSIPVSLLIQMIKSEIQRADEIVAELNRKKEMEEESKLEQNNDESQPNLIEKNNA